MKKIPLKDMVDIIDKAYGGDGAISSIHNGDKDCDYGDGLAKFIYNEIIEPFSKNKNLSLRDIDSMGLLIIKAHEQLQSISNSISDKYFEMRYGK